MRVLPFCFAQTVTRRGLLAGDLRRRWPESKGADRGAHVLSAVAIATTVRSSMMAGLAARASTHDQGRSHRHLFEKCGTPPLLLPRCSGFPTGDDGMAGSSLPCPRS